jgi:hypothetical protein
MHLKFRTHVTAGANKTDCFGQISGFIWVIDQTFCNRQLSFGLAFCLELEMLEPAKTVRRRYLLVLIAGEILAVEAI